MDDHMILEPLLLAGDHLLDPIMGDHLIWRQEVLPICIYDEYDTLVLTVAL